MSNKRSLKFAIAFTALTLLTGFSASICRAEDAPPDTPTVTKDQQNPLPIYTGPKKRLAVADLEVKVTATSSVNPNASGGLTSTTSLEIPPPSDFGTGLTEMLTTALVESGRFIVLERKALSDIQTEQGIQATATADQASAVGTGKLLAAQAIIRGAVTEFSYNRSSTGGSASFSSGIGLSSGKSTALVAIDVRIYDVATGQILDSVRAEGKAKSSAISINVEKDNNKMSAASFKQSPLGHATRQAIEKAVAFITTKMQKIEWEGRVADLEADDHGVASALYINAGTATGLKEGNVLEILHPGRSITDPDTRVVIGRTRDTRVGCCKIESCTKDLATAKPTDGTGFKIGDIVRFVEQPKAVAGLPVADPQPK